MAKTSNCKCWRCFLFTVHTHRHTHMQRKTRFRPAAAFCLTLQAFFSVAYACRNKQAHEITRGSSEHALSLLWLRCHAKTGPPVNECKDDTNTGQQQHADAVTQQETAWMTEYDLARQYTPCFGDTDSIEDALSGKRAYLYTVHVTPLVC